MTREQAVLERMYDALNEIRKKLERDPISEAVEHAQEIALQAVSELEDFLNE